MKINFYVGFNNYYNRKVIVHDSLDDYQDKLLLTIPNVNFKLNDGINTEQIVNTTQVIDSQVFSLSNTPDYAIVAEDDNTIISRWFVMEYESLIYKNQYRAVLRRDVIADNFNAVIEAPCFIEKATVIYRTDPAIFNNENMGFNQIKTSETLLKDLTNCPWIVGFVPTTSNWETDGQYSGPELKYRGTTYDLYDANNTLTYNGPVLNNMPFKMFCMPFTDMTFYQPSENGNYFNFEAKKDVMLAFANNISKTIGAGNIFDIQILPYCPLRTENNSLLFRPEVFGEHIGENKVTGGGISYAYIIKKKGENPNSSNSKGVFYWCDINKFTFDIDYSLPLPSTALEMKVKNETEMYRLCSSNFQGQFEFNPIKNGGVMKFNVDCMYQPFSPYIHINPDFGSNLTDFKSLYGSDFNDVRGLICGGDFSLPQESNAWANYQQNNKNFQASFDRQISNMEFNNRISMISQSVSAATGALQGATGMGITGGMLGGHKGAVAGSAIGAGVSAAGGIADTILLANQQKETLDYTKDQFGYQLGNIKAMPNSVSKTNPFTNNNKIFPVLEYYTCTAKEVQALKDKLTYNGMTIMRISKIKDWLLDDYSYIKGKLIMLDSSIEEDYHTVVEIAQELDKGIRAKKEA